MDARTEVGLRTGKTGLGFGRVEPGGPLDIGAGQPDQGEDHPVDVERHVPVDAPEQDRRVTLGDGMKRTGHGIRVPGRPRNVTKVIHR